MMRLVLVAAFIAIVIFAIVAAVGTVSAASHAVAGKDENPMPVKFRRITYILLILLMLGVTSGLLGGL